MSSKSSVPWGCEYEEVNFSPEGEKVLRGGIYTLWPKLGRAPSVDELAGSLGLAPEAVKCALEELDGHYVTGIELEPGTHQVLFAWPFSSCDYGIRVTLEEAQPVFARCAVDALGMSSMFGRPAHIVATTPLHRKDVIFKVDGSRVLSGDNSVKVSYGEKNCDLILFFSDSEELEAFEKQSGQKLKILDLNQAIARGVYVFGNKFKSS